MSPASLLRERRGATAVEFAFVAPVFLMMLFLLLDGGRMMFAKQSLNELAAAAARCAALKPTGCATASAVQSWAVSRGLARSNLSIVASDVAILTSTTCNGQASMAQATIAMTYRKGAMTLLPQSVVPATLTSVSCFPVAT